MQSNLEQLVDCDSSMDTTVHVCQNWSHKLFGTKMKSSIPTRAMRSRNFIVCTIFLLVAIPIIYFPVCLLAYQTNCGAVTKISDQVMIMASPQRYINDPNYSVRTFDATRPFLREFKNPCYLLKDEKHFFGHERIGGDKGLVATVGVRKGDVLENDTLRCLPYYYVLGWMKCGTTELFQKMMAHPEIMRPPQKEPAWFNLFRLLDGGRVSTYVDSHDALISRKLAANYRYYGEQVSMIFGDHSTHTIDSWGTWGFDPDQPYDNGNHPSVMPDFARNASSARLIHMVNPNAKFIVIMRNPVSRLYSYYRYLVAKSPMDFHNGTIKGVEWWNTCLKEGNSLQQCLFHQPELKTFDFLSPPCSWIEEAINATRQGLYVHYIQEFLQFFPKEQFLFLKFEEFAENSNKAVTEKVFPFLGLQKLDLIGKLQLKIRHGVSTRIGKETSSRISWYLQQKEMNNRSQNFLDEFYAPYNAKLADLMGDNKYLWNT